MKQTDAVLLVTGDKFVNDPDAIPDEDDKSPINNQTPSPNPTPKEKAPATAPTSPSKATINKFDKCNNSFHNKKKIFDESKKK
jgi:hypothetical protein